MIDPEFIKRLWYEYPKSRDTIALVPVLCLKCKHYLYAAEWEANKSNCPNCTKEVTMPKSIYRQRREELTAALRSGEYEQATGQLKTRSGFCCLGVACDLYSKHVEESKWIDNSFSVNHPILNDWEISRTDLNLLDPVAHYYGFKTGGDIEIPGLPNLRDDNSPDGTKTFLTYLNDRGFTFPQIADIIDYFWPDENADEQEAS